MTHNMGVAAKMAYNAGMDDAYQEFSDQLTNIYQAFTNKCDKLWEEFRIAAGDITVIPAVQETLDDVRDDVRDDMPDIYEAATKDMPNVKRP